MPKITVEQVEQIRSPTAASKNDVPRLIDRIMTLPSKAILFRDSRDLYRALFYEKNSSLTHATLIPIHTMAMKREIARQRLDYRVTARQPAINYSICQR